MVVATVILLHGDANVAEVVAAHVYIYIEYHNRCKCKRVTSLIIARRISADTFVSFLLDYKTVRVIPRVKYLIIQKNIFFLCDHQ